MSEQIKEQIGQLLRNDLGPEEIFKQLNLDTPTKKQWVWRHPEWKAFKQRRKASKVKASTPTPPVETKEPSIQYDAEHKEITTTPPETRAEETEEQKEIDRKRTEQTPTDLKAKWRTETITRIQNIFVNPANRLFMKWGVDEITPAEKEEQAGALTEFLNEFPLIMSSKAMVTLTLLLVMFGIWVPRIIDLLGKWAEKQEQAKETKSQTGRAAEESQPKSGDKLMGYVIGSPSHGG